MATFPPSHIHSPPQMTKTLCDRRFEPPQNNRRLFTQICHRFESEAFHYVHLLASLFKITISNQERTHALTEPATTCFPACVHKKRKSSWISVSPPPLPPHPPLRANPPPQTRRFSSHRLPHARPGPPSPAGPLCVPLFALRDQSAEGRYGSQASPRSQEQGRTKAVDD